jgi:TolB-like protein/DNA-binding winged helix-turn-helix (wHTH) protein/Tfp pilus assembly protein PilF
MQDAPHHTYSFGDFTFDLTSGSLLREGREVPLRPKSFEILKYLVTNSGRLVPKEELLAAVWAGTFVTEDALLKRLKDLRTALDDDGQDYIKTVPRRGYIFRAEVKEAAPPNPVAEEAEVAPRSESSGPSGRRPSARKWALAVAALALMLGAGAALVHRQPGPPGDRVAPEIRSMAVLPLKNLGDDPSNEYFSDGMTDSLITALSQVRDLKVISRGSVVRFKGKEADPREVGKQLGVAAVLEGSVRKSADSVRVTVRLVSVADGRVLWARDTRERALGDVFALQDEIARGVAAELTLDRDGDGPQRLTRRDTNDIEAYQSYLKGRYFWNKRTDESLKKSIAYFDQAIQADPAYALAYVGLADSYLVLKSLSLVTRQEAHDKAEPALRRALEIDETLGEAHTSLAWLRFAYDWNWPEADLEFRRAIQLQPNDATSHQWYSEYLSAMRRFDESFAEIRRAQQLEPASPIINVIAAQTYFFARRYERAIEECHRTLELDPDFYIAHDYLGWAYTMKGMHAAALAAAKRAKEIEDTPLQLCEIGQVEAAAGDRDGARRVLRELTDGSKRKPGPRHSYRMARINAHLGELDAAFESLEAAFNEREENLVWLNVDPHLDNLRPDPRFSDLLRRVGFAPEGS